MLFVSEEMITYLKLFKTDPIRRKISVPVSFTYLKTC